MEELLRAAPVGVAFQVPVVVDVANPRQGQGTAPTDGYLDGVGRSRSGNHSKGLASPAGVDGEIGLVAGQGAAVVDQRVRLTDRRAGADEADVDVGGAGDGEIAADVEHVVEAGAWCVGQVDVDGRSAIERKVVAEGEGGSSRTKA